MNKKIIAPSLLLIFLLLTVFLMGCDNQSNFQGSGKNTLSDSTSEISKAERVEVVCFYGTHRCISCKIVEEYAKKTLEEFFQSELRTGKITFKSINIELPENRDIVVKYQARGSSLFINAIKDGKDNISEDVDVWYLTGDEQAYKEYFKEKIEKILN